MARGTRPGESSPLESDELQLRIPSLLFMEKPPPLPLDKATGGQLGITHRNNPKSMDPLHPWVYRKAITPALGSIPQPIKARGMDRKSLSGKVLPEHSQFCVWVLTTPDPSSGKWLVRMNCYSITSPARNSCQSHRTVCSLSILAWVRQLKPEVHAHQNWRCIGI